MQLTAQVLAMAVSAMLAGQVPEPAQSRPSCEGERATLVGTRATERLIGTSRRDVVVAFGGADEVIGFEGDDIICAGAGRDFVFAGPGDDTVGGGEGGDTLAGAAGDDVLRGHGGPDFINAGSEDDLLVGGSGLDAASFASYEAPILASLEEGWATGQGVDRLVGFEALVGSLLEDELIGDDSANELSGRSGHDRIYGGGGPDRIGGGPGYDLVYGGEGDDSLLGARGNDRLHGEAGGDRISGYDGDDFVSGGPDDDPELSGDVGNDVVRGDEGDDRLFGEFARCNTAYCEAAAGDDELDGGLGGEDGGGDIGDAGNHVAGDSCVNLEVALNCERGLLALDVLRVGRGDLALAAIAGDLGVVLHARHALAPALVAAELGDAMAAAPVGAAGADPAAVIPADHLLALAAAGVVDLQRGHVGGSEITLLALDAAGP